MARVVSTTDEALVAQVTRRVPMRYAAGADPALDRPGHVRAASGIAWAGGRLAVAQDDASFVALVDPATGLADAITLPAGPGGLRQFDDGRGNKADKLDLEAIAAVEAIDAGERPMLVVFGSGSSPRRESIVLVRAAGTPRCDVVVRRVPALYARLRAMRDFAGSEMNVEGVIALDDDRLRLFARGNGASSDGVEAIDATCDLSWSLLAAHLAHPDDANLPAPGDVVQYDLGTIAGVRLGFTDAALVARDDTDGDAAAMRRILYTAAAEASPDATRDGDVAGSAIGVIEERPDGIRARWAVLRGVDGRPFDGKVEGMAMAPDVPGRLYVVVDRDDPARPSELCEVRLSGRWGFAARAGDALANDATSR